MGILLDERTPRSWTPAYATHRLRAVARVQVPWLLPSIAAAAYFCFAVAAATAARVAQSSLTIAAAGLCGGLPAALGIRALWTWIAARLYPWLDAHPIPQATVKAGYRLPARPECDEPCMIIGECHPDRIYTTDGGYTLDYSHCIAEQYSAVPEWSVLPAKALVTGLIVFGDIGSGKTAYVVRPSVFRLFHHPSRPGGLVMDAKASLVDPLVDEMRNAGREADILPVGPGRATKWNPLHMPLSSPATIADSLLTAIENVNGAPFTADSRWIRNGAAHLAEGCIGLLRLRTGYVSALSVRMLLGELIARTQGTDEPGKAANELIDALFAGHDAPTKDAQEFQHYSGLVVARMSEDDKFRAIYVSELLALLVPLTSPRVCELYNAPEDELNMPAWPEAINRGLVVVLDCNSAAVPALAVILGMLLKLGYEQAMLSRLDWQRHGLCDAERFMVLCIDEYQNYASPGDADYLALCRESKSMSVFLTQGYASIVQRIGEERTKVILQSMRNRLVLSQKVPDSVADLLGQVEVEKVDRSIQENIQAASLQATGRFAGQSSVAESLVVRRQREHVVDAQTIKHLPKGQGILESHDGSRPVPTHRVYLRPWFAFDTRHVDLEAKAAK